LFFTSTWALDCCPFLTLLLFDLDCCCSTCHTFKPSNCHFHPTHPAHKASATFSGQSTCCRDCLVSLLTGSTLPLTGEPLLSPLLQLPPLLVCCLNLAVVSHSGCCLLSTRQVPPSPHPVTRLLPPSRTSLRAAGTAWYPCSLGPHSHLHANHYHNCYSHHWFLFVDRLWLLLFSTWAAAYHYTTTTNTTTTLNPPPFTSPQLRGLCHLLGPVYVLPGLLGILVSFGSKLPPSTLHLTQAQGHYHSIGPV
jgi:hypothetical protein